MVIQNYYAYSWLRPLLLHLLASIYSSSPLLLHHFRRVSPDFSCRLAFAITPIYCSSRTSMAHTFAQATLGFTQANTVDHPKIAFAAKEIDVTEWKGEILAVGVTEKDMADEQVFVQSNDQQILSM